MNGDVDDQEENETKDVLQLYIWQGRQKKQDFTHNADAPPLLLRLQNSSNKTEIQNVLKLADGQIYVLTLKEKFPEKWKYS